MTTFEYDQSTGAPVAVWHDTELGRGDSILDQLGGPAALRADAIGELLDDIEACGLGLEAVLVADSREGEMTTVRAAARCTRPGCIAQEAAWQQRNELDQRHHLAGGDPHAEASAALTLRTALDEVQEALARAGLSTGPSSALAQAAVPPEAWAQRAGVLSAALWHLVEQVQPYAAPHPRTTVN